MKFSTTLIALAAAAGLASAAPIELAKRAATYTAPATYFYQNGNPGSCGWYSSDSDYVVAMPAWLHQDSSCGKSIRVTHNGQSIVAKIADTCPTCDGRHIDLSVGAFKGLGVPLSAGQVEVQWTALW